MSKKTQLAAVITIAGQLDSSVSKAFGAAVRETSKMGKALDALRTKEKLVFSGKEQEQSLRRAEEALERLRVKRNKALQAASNAPGDRVAQREAKALSAAFEKAAASADKEFSAFERLQHELKAVGVDSTNLVHEQERIGSEMDLLNRKISRRESWQSVGSAIGNVGSEMKKLAFHASLVAGTMGYFFKTQLLETASTMETLKARLRSVSKSSDDAKQSWNWIKQFEPKVPFDIEGVTAAFQQLKQQGIDPVKTGLMQTIGGASSAMGEKDMSRATQALLNAEMGNARMLKAYGIMVKQKKGMGAFDWIDFTGKRHSDTIKMDRAVVQAEVQRIWNDKYRNAIKSRMTTWDGMMTSLHSQWMLFKMDIMDAGLFDFMKDKLNTLLDTVAKMRQTGELDKWAHTIGDGLRDAGKAAWDLGVKTVNAWNSVNDTLKPVLGEHASLKAALGGIAAVELTPLVTAVWGLGSALVAANVAGGPVLWTVEGLGLAGLTIYKNWEPIKDYFEELKTTAKDTFQVIDDALKPISDKFHDWEQTIEHVLAKIPGLKSLGENTDYATVPKGVSAVASAPKGASVLRDQRPLPDFSLPPVRGGGNTLHYHTQVTVNAAPGQDPAKVAAETKWMMEQQYKQPLYDN